VPTYDYQCRNCGNVTEVIHAMSEQGPTACERCGGALRRVLYPAGIIFKGSGFYSTDSRAAAKSGSATATPSESTSKSEPKGGDAAPKPGSGTTKPSGTTSATEA
jgi:putative FmdB family regulatory protein